MSASDQCAASLARKLRLDKARALAANCIIAALFLTVAPMKDDAPITATLSELDKRSRDVFREIVETYLDTGEPVGSRTLSKSGVLELSPASIRNTMADLAQAGLLTAPHASAGRLPTHAGLRLFVDGLLQIGDLESEERRDIEDRVSAAGRRPGPARRVCRGQNGSGWNSRSDHGLRQL